jgi:hypothetical protein
MIAVPITAPNQPGWNPRSLANGAEPAAKAEVTKAPEAGEAKTCPGFAASVIVVSS